MVELARLFNPVAGVIVPIEILPHQFAIASVKSAFRQPVERAIVVCRFQNEAALKVPRIVDEIASNVIQAFFGDPLPGHHDLFGEEPPAIVERELGMRKEPLAGGRDEGQLPPLLVNPVPELFPVGECAIRFNRMFLRNPPLRIMKIHVAGRVRFLCGNQFQTRQISVAIELMGTLELGVLGYKGANGPDQFKTIEVAPRRAYGRTGNDKPEERTDNEQQPAGAWIHEHEVDGASRMLTSPSSSPAFLTSSLQGPLPLSRGR